MLSYIHLEESIMWHNGQANYEFFLEVFRLYSKLKPEGKISKFVNLLSEILIPKFETQNNNSENVFDALEVLFNKIWNRKKARDFGMKEEEIKSFAINVFENQQRLLANSYELFKVEDLEEIYRNIY